MRTGQRRRRRVAGPFSLMSAVNYNWQAVHAHAQLDALPRRVNSLYPLTLFKFGLKSFIKYNSYLRQWGDIKINSCKKGSQK